MNMMENIRRMSLIRVKSTTGIDGKERVYGEPVIGIVTYLEHNGKGGWLSVFASRHFSDHQVIEILMQDATEFYNNMSLGEMLEDEANRARQKINHGNSDINTTVLAMYETHLSKSAAEFMKKAYDILPEEVQRKIIANKVRVRELMNIKD